MVRNMVRMKVLNLVLMAAIVIGALAACARPATPAPTPRATPAATPAPTPSLTPRPTPAPAVADWDKVVEAAKKEGRVVVYDAMWTMVPPERAALFQAFEEATGIKPEITTLQPPESRERIRAEQRSGQIMGDVMASAVVMPYDMYQAGYTQPAVVPAGLEKDIWRLEPYYLKGSQNHVVTTYFYPLPSAVINTKLVKPEDEPKSWADLLNPKWKGKMVTTDPRLPGAQPEVGELRKVLGEDYYPGLAKLDIMLIPGKPGPTERVARGENAIAFTPEPKIALAAIKAGAPLKLLQFKDAVPTVSFGMAIQKNAPHPNAAKVLINWLLTKEGQTVHSKAGLNPSLRKDVPQDWLPPELQFREGYKYLWYTEDLVAQSTELLKYGKQVFGE